MKYLPQGLITRIRQLVYSCFGKMCVECFSENNVEQHHNLSNSESNRSLYPLFLDSPMNRTPLCGSLGLGCHEKFKNKYKKNHREAELVEWYLEELVWNANKYKSIVERRRLMHGFPCEGFNWND